MLSARSSGQHLHDKRILNQIPCQEVMRQTHPAHKQQVKSLRLSRRNEERWQRARWKETESDRRKGGDWRTPQTQKIRHSHPPKHLVKCSYLYSESGYRLEGRVNASFHSTELNFHCFSMYICICYIDMFHAHVLWYPAHDTVFWKHRAQVKVQKWGLAFFLHPMTHDFQSKYVLCEWHLELRDWGKNSFFFSDSKCDCDLHCDLKKHLQVCVFCGGVL